MASSFVERCGFALVTERVKAWYQPPLQTIRLSIRLLEQPGHAALSPTPISR